MLYIHFADINKNLKNISTWLRLEYELMGKQCRDPDIRYLNMLSRNSDNSLLLYFIRTHICNILSFAMNNNKEERIFEPALFR